MHRLSVHPEDDTFAVWFDGRVDAAAGKDAFLRTLAHPAFSQSSRMLWDLRAVTEAKVEFADLFGAVQGVLPKLQQFSAASRAVILVEDDTLFGIARMLEQVVDAMSPLHVRIARSEDEAERQLGVPAGRIRGWLADTAGDLPGTGPGD